MYGDSDHHTSSSGVDTVAVNSTTRPTKCVSQWFSGIHSGQVCESFTFVVGLEQCPDSEAEVEPEQRHGDITEIGRQRVGFGASEA